MQKIFILDRCVISKIKSHSRLKSDELELLKMIDTAENQVSPVQALEEGQVGWLQTEEQLQESFRKDTLAISQYFKMAKADTFFAQTEQTLPSAIGAHQSTWDTYSGFVKYVQRLLAQKVGRTLRKLIRDQMVAKATASDLQAYNPMVVCAMYCLYGNEHARAVLKPRSSPGNEDREAYNAMQDIHAITQLEIFRFVAGFRDLELHFITFDLGLRGFHHQVQPRMVTLPNGPMTIVCKPERHHLEEMPDEEWQELHSLLSGPAQRARQSAGIQLTVRLSIPKFWD